MLASLTSTFALRELLKINTKEIKSQTKPLTVNKNEFQSHMILPCYSFFLKRLCPEASSLPLYLLA